MNRRSPAIAAITLLVSIVGAELAAAQGRVFWTDSGSGRIERANADGSERITLIDGITPVAIVIRAGWIYWSERSPARIRRAELDGTNIVDLITTDLVDPHDIELDWRNQKIVWTEPIAGRIRRANFDGSNVETIVVGNALEPTGLALDPRRNRMYWTDRIGGRIQSTPLGGGKPETVLSGLFDPTDIELDWFGRRMIWAEPGPALIRRASTEGTNLETLFAADAIAPDSLEVDFRISMLYFTDPRTLRILAVSFDTTVFREIAAGDVTMPEGLAFEPGCDPADMNCDGYVNAFDIEPFFGLLFNCDLCTPCSNCAGDVNGDGRIDAFDIEPFLECLFP